MGKELIFKNDKTSPDNKNITNAGFITFGYVNTLNNITYEVRT